MKNNIRYSINKEIFNIIFCVKKETSDISNQLKKHYSDRKVLLVIDKNLDKNFRRCLLSDLKKLNRIDFHLLEVEGSKRNKNTNFVFKIIDKCIKEKFTKKSVVISCGGGVVGDAAALASSLYFRGLIYYHVPTTMTAIVDSCIGGKTGINYNGIINSVGNYYHPKSVFISKNVIEKIPHREFMSGIPEIIKCGLIDNVKIFEMLLLNQNKYFKRDYDFLYKLIKLTLLTKIKFFKDDIFENAKRLNLNFGHTFAHAIEIALKGKKSDVIRHGEAVGVGMLCEIYYSEGKSEKFLKLKNILRFYNLSTDLNHLTKGKLKNSLKNEIFKNIFLDKKKIGKFPRIIKLIRVGKSKIIEMKNNKKIKDTIDKVLF